MIIEILLSAALVGPSASVAVNDPPEQTLQTVRELYTYATQSVQVEPEKVRRMVEEIRGQLGESAEGSADALASLENAAEQSEPDGREIRVHARDLYASLVNEEA